MKSFIIDKYIKFGKRFLFIFVCMLYLTSCNIDDTLNTSPMDRISDDALWKDKALIETFITNTYRIIPNGFRYSFYNLSIISDELNARQNAWAWAAIAGNMTPDDLGQVDFWTSNDTPTNTNRNYWKTINQVNIFLQKIEDVPNNVDAATKNRMVGEMKAIRAFSYFNLISLFGGVPLITKPFALDDDFMVPRNSYKEVMDFVLSELEESIGLLPLEYDSQNKGRVTKGAAMAIKARALLYRASPLNNPENDIQKWKDAANAAKAIIDLNKYSLFPDYRTLFLEENIYNSEAIWQRPYNQLITKEAAYIELSSYPNGYNGFGQIHPIQNLVDDYETIRGLLPENDPQYDPQNPYVDRDPRFYASILHDGMFWKGREVETFLPGGKDSNEGPVSGWNATQTGYYPRKFCNERIDNPSGNNMSQTPYTWFRYAEVLLNYAEASYFLGDEVTAREYVNMVRKRPSVNMPEITESGEALFKRIVNERRIELVFEQHRWFDIRRLKIAPQVMNEDFTRMKITKKPDGTKTYEVLLWKEVNFKEPRDYLLPIPQSEIEKNSLLEQNPGY